MWPSWCRGRKAAFGGCPRVRRKRERRPTAQLGGNVKDAGGFFYIVFFSSPKRHAGRHTMNLVPNPVLSAFCCQPLGQSHLPVSPLLQCPLKAGSVTFSKASTKLKLCCSFPGTLWKIRKEGENNFET
ncbi:hypothetical protein AV530_016083 [Patagioenas fasciata monilis]|uniref:Uncharacterized protein n=1 Tax=Patagioenas fasciata monilis TaxID=372326 RepID=A0A1V4KLT5_PATFA|nr:hypothetical protein AV530_016083 [Patagioenas fasciata monilis]